MTASDGSVRPAIRPQDSMHRRLNTSLRIGYRLHEKGHRRLGLAVDAVNRLVFTADIPGRLALPDDVTFMHNGLGTIVDEHVVFEGPALIYQHVTLGYAVRWGGDDAVPTIGSHVIIGAGATVVGGIRIGSGSFIGAGAVVNFDVPDNHMVAPGRATMKPLEVPGAQKYWETC
ncbi:hypothetical protein [Allobranchiibius sp. GilTou38]|uniref:serine O-acetyltransferase n=1 Tax=Allobranchiibius sp. GilTou38 TaxID=2815210 RepID=UPI001AA1855E|nr:hypothetical protein [Allobranchiibius sp. GilTou38]MBO1767885.1 hypothetical protein [Allobranchiibius sp. GilTou38]